MEDRLLINDYIQKFFSVLDVSEEDIKSKERTRDLSDKRMILGYILNNFFEMTTTSTGKVINRDHSTIVHYCKVLPDIVSTDINFSKMYSRAKIIAYAYLENYNKEKGLIETLMNSNSTLRKILSSKDKELSAITKEMKELKKELTSKSIQLLSL